MASCHRRGLKFSGPSKPRAAPIQVGVTTPLVGLFADPSRLDRGGERLEAGVGRQVGKVIFALARGAALADQPSLFARHVLHALVMDALWRTIGDEHAHGGEGGRQRPFGFLYAS